MAFGGYLPAYFFFNDTATTEIYTLSLHDALPISPNCGWGWAITAPAHAPSGACSSASSASPSAVFSVSGSIAIPERRYFRTVGNDAKQPIKMLNDRVRVQIPERLGERRSRGRIVI